ncbi:MAG: cation:proton antiporter [Candidatus Altiarchaeota archaeon]|nr:cation:proton antiporter [Candidatus Altiarchaeota archaeon]
MANLHIIELLFILLISWYLGRLFRHKLDMPPMLGELLAGLIFGPSLLNLVQPNEYISFLAELGIFFLMFYAGTETDPKAFFKSMKPSILCGILGFIIPLILGYYGSKIFMPSLTEFQAIFIGLGLSITAIAVNARILMDLNMQQSRIGHVLIGAALVDDILSLGVFSALVDTIQSGNTAAEISLQSLYPVFSSMAHVALFFLLTYGIGKLVLPLLNRFYNEEGHGFTFSLLTAFIFAYIAEAMGLHLIIGAFIAGLFVREELNDKMVLSLLNDRLMVISYGFLGPVFFVSLAFHVDLIGLLHNLPFLTLILVVAVFGKFTGSYIGCILSGLKKSEGVVVSAGMNGRGAVELILVSVGVELGILTPEIVTVLVSMAFITTFMTPIAFKKLLTHYRGQKLL